VTADGDRAGDRRPLVVRLLVAWLALVPVLQALSLAGLRVANFAPDRPWNYVAYGLAAPYVAWLVWRQKPRARFAAYVFLTHEAVRGIHFHRRDAVAIAVLWVLLLQLPAARRFMPSLRPAEMRARWRRQLTGHRGGGTGAEPSAPPADATRSDSPPSP
jgi:glucose dehydrogenase